MKIYRCETYDSQLGTLLSWHASKRDAEAEGRRFMKEADDDSEGWKVYAVEIPTTKKGLIDWLNWNFKTDNG